MEHLKYVPKKIWNKRKDWFYKLLYEYESKGSFLLSEQACALIAEVQSCYCAGAWVSVIILSFAVIDAQLRETEIPHYKGNSKALLNELGFDDKFQKLRKRRNSIMHLDINSPAITVDQQWGNRKELEEEAKDAIKLMVNAFFSNPGV